MVTGLQPLRMLRYCQHSVQLVWEVAGTDTAKTQEMLSDPIFQGGFSKWLHIGSVCAESSTKIPTEAEPMPRVL